MPEKTKSTKKSESIKQEIEFHYLKMANYRSYHADGVFGGITPQGNIYMELFLERAPTPKSIIHEINEDGSLGRELSRQGKAGLIREIEAGVVLDLATAEVVVNWLTDKIGMLKSQSSVGKDK